MSTVMNKTIIGFDYLRNSSSLKLQVWSIINEENIELMMIIFLT